MKPSVLLVASLLAASLSLGCGNSGSGSAPPATSGTAKAPAEAPAGRVVQVKVTDKGFEPKVIEAKKGETVSLEFTRSTESECLKAMAIPSLDIKRDLPVGTPVVVNVKAEKEGEIGFQCWMAMFTGKIEVKN